MYRGDSGMMEKEMEATIWGLGLRVVPKNRVPFWYVPLNIWCPNRIYSQKTLIILRATRKHARRSSYATDSCRERHLFSCSCVICFHKPWHKDSYSCFLLLCYCCCGGQKPRMVLLAFPFLRRYTQLRIPSFLSGLSVCCR